ncbi:MAG TPA: SDR family NAD(P)-dependent oxidoreductase, partial [Blastocatellia bacterium]|nr:SDR family NAD(P)-dependent oxidoreductase [Blastocatellia bacterium]
MERVAALTPPRYTRDEMQAHAVFEDLQRRLLWGQLQLLGFTLTAESWQITGQVLPSYRPWLDETARVLRAGGYLRPDRPDESLETLWGCWAQCQNSDYLRANLTNQAELVGSTLQALPQILTGKIRVTDILFPNSQMTRVEKIYKHNSKADYFNSVVAQAIVTIIDARLAQGHRMPVRILEIGAGTGGTTEIVLAALRSYRDQIDVYTYTDISKAFLMHAESAYGPGSPYLQCQLFNVERPLSEQNLALGSYDIVIAANVLHATRNMRATLRNAKATLKRNGVLLINEITANNLFIHLTFGLTEGWWLAEDPHLRLRGCPAVSIDTWKMLLKDEGFDRVYWPAAVAKDLGQQVIMARSDGLIRQPQPLPFPAPETRKEPKEETPAVSLDSTPPAEDMLAGHLRRVIAEQLHLSLRVPTEQISYVDSFADYGVDSISGVQLIHQINAALGTNLETTHLYDYSSINRLADYLLSEWRGVVTARLIPLQPAAASETDSASASQVDPPPPETKAAPRQVAEPPRFHQPIAIIGMSGRFAQSADVDELWGHLSNGDDLIRPVTRWSLPETTPTGAAFCRYGGLLNDIDHFDPMFFNISGTEAATMDPQQRLFLEEAWSALEDAGYAGDGMDASRCGVYVGYNGTDYQTLLGDQAPAQAMWGNAGSILSARISYYLNLQGPAITVDTACSSSLVAVHLACQGLWGRETEIALAGGVFVQSTPGFYLLGGRAEMLSPTGRCRTFDAGADGFVPGEGAGVVVLKRLSEAMTDGDHIYGVIVGSGINQDGTTNGITAPSAASQERLQRQVYDTFKIHPENIRMIEAHGTGTRLGDPIECRALTQAFRKDTAKKRYCAIGSIKTNLGHTAAAAGIAGLIKILLSLKHRQIPPSLHYETCNPAIDLEESPFYVNIGLTNWEVAPGRKRCAAINAFGLSGTNAHLVIEEADEIERRHAERPGYLMMLSARSPEQLRQQARRIIGQVESAPAIDLGNLCFTLSVGRKHFEYRLACVPTNNGELIEILRRWLERGTAPQIFTGYCKDGEHREQSSLKRYGHQCILQCRKQDLKEHEHLEYLAALGELFVQGYRLDYGSLFSQDGYARLSLPAYPFAKEQYWVRSSQQAVATAEFQLEAHPPESWSFNGSGLRLPSDRPNPNPLARTLLVQPVWESPVLIEREGPVAMTAAEHHLLLIGDFSAEILRRLREALPDTSCLTIAAASGSLAEQYEATVLAVFEKIRSILATKPTHFVLFQILVNTGGRGPDLCLTGLSGLLKTASQENPKLITQCLDLEGVDAPEILIDLVRINSQDFKHRDIRYRDHQRQVKRFERLAVLDEGESAKSPWRDRGVYLITGGLGGLGSILATDIARNARNATLILVNRSELTASKLARIDQLKEFGISAEYQQVDLAERREVQRLIAHIQEQYGALTGIIHSAGVIEDNFALKKSREEVRRVLAPKVAGLVNLDEATKDLVLDQFICFSAFAGVYGNPGQTDYAAANAFMDLYADYRNELVGKGWRHGHTVSIAWPLWAEGGMQIDETVKTGMTRSGLMPLSTPMGLSALYRSFSMKATSAQIVVLHGDIEKLSGLVNGVVGPSEHSGQVPVSEDAHRQLQSLMVTQLKGLLAGVTSISIDRIGGDESLESYGIDSIMITQLNQRLEGIYGEISKTLFFEYRTLNELSRYLVEAYPAGCRQWTGTPETIIPAGPAANGATAKDRDPFSSTSKGRDRLLSEASLNDVADDPVAIIGLSGRYPQAATLGDFWENLKAGRDCIGELPQGRWPLEGFYDADARTALKNGASYSKWGGFLEGFADFDPLFFGISPREAENIDPQERLFIESCWEVIEDAGYTRDSLQSRHQGRVGVYAGITKTGFDLYGPPLWAQGEDVFPHTSFSSTANRVSYLFNFNGPSLPIDTMCAASLTAIHEACEHLKRDECELAIAGGVNLYLHPSNYVVLCAHHMLSVDGKCRSFGAGGNGFVPGEGVGTVLLKLLSKAEADGDHIYGIIRGTAINHGGKTHGYTVPSPNAQADLIAKAMAKAQIDPRAVSYIEAHGTGTELGDPIEVTGLTKAFNQKAPERLIQTCTIGSVKSNIGHCESAAGIAGVTKVLLQLKHRQLVPSLHSQTLNPNIDFSKTPFKVQQQLEPWNRPTIVVDGIAREYPRIAGISSFGAGGANAHVIIEEYLERESPPPAFIIDEHRPAIIVLSAQTEMQLKLQARNLISSIQNDYPGDSALPNIAYTLQVGREAMEERLAFAVSSVESLLARLQSFIDGTLAPHGIHRGSVKRDRESLSIFTAIEELQAVIGRWVEQYRYKTLLGLWVKGLDLDWNALYGERRPRRVSLPTYPFARERYWLPEVKPDRRVAPAPSPEPETALLRYVEEWSPQPDGELPIGNQPLQLIHFTEDEAQSEALAALLEGRRDQSRLIRVVKGARFRRLDSTHYEVP